MLGERQATADDGIAGVTPRVVYEPTTQAECVEAFEAARARRFALAVVGGKTELGLGDAPARLDAVVSTRRLDRVLEYAPSDQVVTVEAGLVLSELQRTLRARGQRLAFDAPSGDRATLGGLIATNNFGPLRTRFGSLRDLIIGVSIIRASGAVARGGGKVVKNVAGFDLPKLVVGALGTLGMIATATLRLHPAPEEETTLTVRGLTARAVRALLVEMRREHVEPAASAALLRAEGLELLLRFEGFRAGVREQCDRAAARLSTIERRFEELAPAQATAAWAEHDTLRTRGTARTKISALPAALGAVAANVVPPLRDALSSAAVVCYPTLGCHFVTGDVDDPQAFATAVSRARAWLAAAGGWLVVQDLPAAARPGVDVWGPPPPGFVLMKRVKARFDPDHRLNPGRFVGGL